MTAEIIETEEVKVEVKKEEVDALAHWNMLISEDIDFRVEKRGIHTYSSDGGIHMPDHSATIRINTDGSESPLWVVGSRYEIVDHRDVIKQFAEVLDRANLNAEVKHQVFQNGCRIYSEFLLDKSFKVEGKEVRPFFTLTTSHDGSLRVGFLMGATIGKRTIHISKTVYGAHAKHTKGINIEKTLEEVFKALTVFTEEIIPMWVRMHNVVVSRDESVKIIEKAIARKAITKKRTDEAVFSEKDSLTVWDVYTSLVDSVSVVRGKCGTGESVFDRNTKVSEFFSSLVSDSDMSDLKAICGK